jgi:hypothetical protein
MPARTPGDLRIEVIVNQLIHHRDDGKSSLRHVVTV